MTDNIRRLHTLAETRTLPDADFAALLTTMTPADEECLYALARQARQAVYGEDVYLRGLIEFTNYCKNNCYYCGLQRENRSVTRYRLTERQILDCCALGYELGYRTFVLQGGEDPYFTDARVCALVRAIKATHPDCAVTLSIGEKTRESYLAYFEAGADRYLLRHETADPCHYALLHPADQTCENRKRCLRDLKDIGFQVGCGMMVGSPFQTVENLIADLRFMEQLQPHMIGIGPFIPQKDTRFRDQSAGTLTDTLHLLGILRLMFPRVLLPATTALGTIDPVGREKGLLAGANVIMPNLSPADVRDHYLLYDGKPRADGSAAGSRDDLERRIASVGCRAVVSRGDYAAETSGARA